MQRNYSTPPITHQKKGQVILFEIPLKLERAPHSHDGCQGPIKKRQPCSPAQFTFQVGFNPPQQFAAGSKGRRHLVPLASFKPEIFLAVRVFPGAAAEGRAGGAVSGPAWKRGASHTLLTKSLPQF